MFRWKLDLAIYDAKRNANDAFIVNSNNKCKAAWKIIKNESGSAQARNSQDIPLSPNTLNDHFVNVAANLGLGDTSDKNSKLFENMLEKCKLPTSHRKFHWNLVDSDYVKTIVYNISASKSEDVYGLSNYVFKYVINAILIPTTYLINLMLLMGIFPECLKLSKVTPIFKKGDKYDANNYRPITIVPILSKIIEAVLTKQLYEYFSSNDLLYHNQFGFRPKHSTTMAIEKIVDYILKGFEEKVAVGACLIDLSRAFDVVSHEMLCRKLSYYGINDKELKLLNSYLLNRLQLVSTNGLSSEYQRVVSGVPQGSVLGPFLFLIFVNDFNFNVSNLSVLYADDTTLLCSDSSHISVNYCLSQSLEQAKAWYSANSLIINESKTERIIFTLKPVNDIDSSCLKPVKLLGIYLDSKLCWDTHVDNLCKKLSRVIFLLRKLRNCVNHEVLITTYFGLFHIHLCYGARLWGNSSAAKKAFMWQKRALRTICNINDDVSCRTYFTNLKIMTLACLFIFQNLIFVKENLSKFTTNDNVHTFYTRHRYDLVTPNVRLSKTLKSHSYLQCKLFNKLPLSVRLMPVTLFKRTVAEWLKARGFYSTNEYFINNDFESLK